MLQHANHSLPVTMVANSGIAPFVRPAETDAPAERISCRVLHIVNGKHFAGAERVQMHLGRLLPKFGCRADFVCLLPGRFKEQFDLPESSCYGVRMYNRFDWTVVDRIRRQVEHVEFDCINGHTPRSAVIASLLARKMKLPWVYHLHSPVIRDTSQWMRNQINSVAERASIASASHLIAVSSSIKQHALRNGWRSDQVTVVPNGVPGVRPERQSTPTPGGRWVLGMVAWIRPRKGLEIALHAVEKLRSEGHDVVLRCVGCFETDGYEKAIHELVNRLNIAPYVEFQGFSNNVPEELAKLDVMVLPSLFGEGMPMVVLEAMAAGLPVIATRVEGTPEAIQHGKQGLLAEPNDSDSLAEQIRLLITGEYDWTTMSESAVQRHADSFSDVVMAEATADIYKRVVQSKCS